MSAGDKSTFVLCQYDDYERAGYEMLAHDDDREKLEAEAMRLAWARYEAKKAIPGRMSTPLSPNETSHRHYFVVEVPKLGATDASLALVHKSA